LCISFIDEVPSVLLPVSNHSGAVVFDAASSSGLKSGDGVLAHSILSRPLREERRKLLKPA
jgi:hypothetical protein